jgi:hypothetical protein
MVRSMRKLMTVTLITAALTFAGTALAASKHGFRDPRAPHEAARILNALPNVDNARCHWKFRMHTIGCTALVKGETAQLYIWSGGHAVLYDVCAAGDCSKAQRAQYAFGRPY